jgi:hypothetical protein
MLAYPFHTNSAVLKIITDMRVRGAWHRLVTHRNEIE